MFLSRVKSFLQDLSSNPERRRFRDMSARNLPIARKREMSSVRLVGYFVGGILLANLVLMTSAAFRGNAATGPVAQEGSLPTRGPLAAAAAERALGSHASMEAKTDAQTDGLAPRESEAEESPEPAKPLITNLCADAREKLVAGLTLYYLQRSRRPDASHDEVLESAGASSLLSGPGDPAAMSSGISCAG
jgi:hypothetical protein